MDAVPPFLTDDEIAKICYPLKQGAAQIKYLREIGVPVSRRPDGRPLVLRHKLVAAPAPDAGRATVAASNEPAWRRAK